MKYNAKKRNLVEWKGMKIKGNGLNENIWNGKGMQWNGKETWNEKG